MFNLKPPQSIFVHASGFHKTAIYLNKDPGGGQFDPFCFAALVTNSAFAAELYLKCLIHLEIGQLIKSGHNLRKLFSMLPEKTQEEIEGLFNKRMEKMPEYDRSKMSKEMLEAVSRRPTNLRDALKAGGDAFVEWRYLYEDGEYSNPFGLFPLPDILRQVILRRQPKWEHFGFRMEKISDAQIKPPKVAE